MDDMVLKSLLKWPNVPRCVGWLGLDSRGNWYLRDAHSQAQGSFQDACRAAVGNAAKGSQLLHPGLIGFINRNYQQDTLGRSYFQNGPQCVYVELAYAPWIWRISPECQVVAHTGRMVTDVTQAIVDETGHLYLHTNLGLGLVHTQDMLLASDCLVTEQWELVERKSTDLPSDYGYVLSPQRLTEAQDT